MTGKGQFTCGSRGCSTREALRSWEVNFAYTEGAQRKNALVKLRLCPPCSAKLNYRHRRKEVKPARKRKMPKEEGEPEGNVKKERLEEEKKDEEIEASSSQNIWSRPVELKEENVEEEIDDYLNDMFL